MESLPPLGHHLGTVPILRLGLSLGLLSCVLVDAVAGTVIPQQEYDKYIDKHRTIQALDSSLFGEQVNLRDGGVVFRVVDGELAGNGPTIRIVRSFRLRENNRFVETTGTGVAGWMLEVPRMKTITNSTTGTQLTSVYGWQVPGSNEDARCTNFAAPGDITFPDPSRYWESYEWWSGYQVVDETGNEQEVLAVGPWYPEVAGYKAVTTGNWRFSCLATTANGEPGEGFLATTPDGTRYWFNHLVYTSADMMTKPIISYALQSDASESMTKQAGGTSDAVVMSPVNDVLYRRHAMLLATRIEDRFGNWLTYQYSGAALTRIDASDGRFLEVSLGTSPATISLGAGTTKRTWSYTKGATTDTVTLPDGSAWTYDFSAFTSANIPATSPYITGDCSINTTTSGGTVQGTATSPSGVTETFTFTLRHFGRSYVLKSCADPDGDGNAFTTIPVDWFSYALTQRTLSGPGIATQTWTYTYSPANASWSQDCAGGCVAEVWTDVTAPDGVRQRSVFSNRFGETENLLLREETYSSANALKRVVRHGYATYPAFSSSTPYAWPQFVGGDLQIRTNKARSERWTPASFRQVEQDGRKFTWQVVATCGSNGTTLCFDQFARPTKVTKSSAPLP